MICSSTESLKNTDSHVYIGSNGSPDWLYAVVVLPGPWAKYLISRWRISSGLRNVVWMEPVFISIVIGCKFLLLSALSFVSAQKLGSIQKTFNHLPCFFSFQSDTRRTESSLRTNLCNTRGLFRVQATPLIQEDCWKSLQSSFFTRGLFVGCWQLFLIEQSLQELFGYV